MKGLAYYTSIASSSRKSACFEEKPTPLLRVRTHAVVHRGRSQEKARSLALQRLSTVALAGLFTIRREGPVFAQRPRVPVLTQPRENPAATSSELTGCVYKTGTAPSSRSDCALRSPAPQTRRLARETLGRKRSQGGRRNPAPLPRVFEYPPRWSCL